MLFFRLSSPPAHNADNRSNYETTDPESERKSFSKPQEIYRNPYVHTVPKASDNLDYCDSQDRHKGERFSYLVSSFILLKAKGNMPHADIGGIVGDCYAHYLDKQQIWCKFRSEYFFHFSPFQTLTIAAQVFSMKHLIITSCHRLPVLSIALNAKYAPGYPY